MRAKATANECVTKLLKTIALSGVLFNALGGAAYAECTCTAMCGDCVSCPRQYETTGSCGACYRGTNLNTSVLCSFVGTLAVPFSAAPFSRQLLPGTRENAIKQPHFWMIPGTPLDLPRPDFTMTMFEARTPPASRSDLDGPLPGAGSQRIWPPVAGNILPGTRPDLGQPNVAGVLPGTRPDTLEPPSAMRLPFPWNLRPGPPSEFAASILPGTRPNGKPAAGILPGTRPDLEPHILPGTRPDLEPNILPGTRPDLEPNIKAPEKSPPKLQPGPTEPR
jgi:hypothetical protein